MGNLAPVWNHRIPIDIPLASNASWEDDLSIASLHLTNWQFDQLRLIITLNEACPVAKISWKTNRKGLSTSDLLVYVACLEK